MWELTLDGDEFWESANDCTDVGLAVMTHVAQSDENVARCLMDNTTDTDRPTDMVSSFQLDGDGVDQEVFGNFHAALTQCTALDDPDR